MAGLFRKLAAAAAISLLWAAPAAAEWRRAESANFIVYGEASEARLREQVALLEDYEGFLRLLTGVKDPAPANKLQVYMLRGRNQLRTVRPICRRASPASTPQPC